jgi:hypothetical protein
MLLLLAKLVIAPLFVIVVTLVGRRLGPRVAGLLAALPVIGGPILGLIVVEQGAAFGARAAFGGAVGAASTMLFAVVYARAARTLGPVASVVLSYASFFIGTAFALLLPITLASAIVVPTLAWWISMRSFPHVSQAFPAFEPSPWDLPARGFATMVLVLLVTGLAESLGPELAGLVTPIPIITAVLAVFTRHQAGPEAAIVLLRALVRGLLSFISFFVVTGVALSHVSIALSLSLGVACAMLVQIIVVRFGIGAHRSNAA